MSVGSDAAREPGRARPAEVVAGYLCAIAIFAAAISIAWRPLRLSLLALVLALLGAAMGANRRLARWALALSTLCFFLGLTVAVVTGHPLW